MFVVIVVVVCTVRVCMFFSRYCDVGDIFLLWRFIFIVFIVVYAFCCGFLVPYIKNCILIFVIVYYRLHFSGIIIMIVLYPHFDSVVNKYLQGLTTNATHNFKQPQ